MEGVLIIITDSRWFSKILHFQQMCFRNQKCDILCVFLQRLKSLCSPAEEWHPYLDVHRGERYSEERCRRSKSHDLEPKVTVNEICSSRL